MISLNFILIICCFNVIVVYINPQESSTKPTTQRTKAPSHDYNLHENAEDDLDEDEDEDENESEFKKSKKKKIKKHELSIKDVSNVFACKPEWISLTDCDIIENFKYNIRLIFFFWPF